MPENLPVGVGAPISMRRVPIKSELGTPGLKRTSGIIIDEPFTTLRGVNGRKTYSEMATDPVIHAFLFAVEKTLQGLDWRVDPADEDAEEDEAATFIDECLHDMSDSFDTTLAEILSFLVYGWSFHEIVYKQRSGEQKDTGSPDDKPSSKYNDGKIGWRKWAPRAHETLFSWMFDRDGGLNGMVQVDPWAARGSIPIPIQKRISMT